MTSLVFNFPAPSPFGSSLLNLIGGDEGQFLLKKFPDGETYVRIHSSVKSRNVIVNASFFHPNEWILSLFFLVDALRTQGANQIGLLAPYLAYMRQDKIFHPGEGLTSLTFAQLLSGYFDYLVTVDPHLHRYGSLGEIYSIPTSVAHAAPLLSTWIQDNVQDPFIIGPDEESRQWVKDIAHDFPFIILKKTRDKKGHVEITWPQDVNMKGKTPVLVDDIISSGETMCQVLRKLTKQKTKPPVCLTIHPIFAGNSYQDIKAVGAQQIISCNSIPHPSNQIDLAPLVTPLLRRFNHEK